MKDPIINKLFETLRNLKKGKLTILLPQFDRTDGITPVTPEGAAEWFDQLKLLPDETLRELGCGLWEKGHYLFPVEWWDYIPEGYPIIDIFGKEEPFSQTTMSQDTRFGMLAYGFRTAEWETSHE